uniref:Protein krueppel n=1 Tax=Stomoxys calcitrans TaxID=35570 RepID=A0A1I8PTT5_STOCA
MIGLCRLCASLKKPELLVAITEESEIGLKLEKCCQLCINMKDALPRSVCQECLNCLNLSYKFYNKVKEAQETLEAFYPTTTEDTANMDEETIAGENVKKKSPNPTKLIKIEKEEKLPKRPCKRGAVRPLKIAKVDSSLPEDGNLTTAKSSNNMTSSSSDTKPKLTTPVKNGTSNKNVPAGHNSKYDLKHKPTTPDKNNTSIQKVPSGHNNKYEFVIENVEVSNEDENDEYMEEVYSLLEMAKVRTGHDSQLDSLHDVEVEEVEQQDVFDLDEYEYEETTMPQHMEEIVTPDEADQTVLANSYEDPEDEAEECNLTMQGGNIKKEFSSLPLHLQVSSWNSYQFMCWVCSTKVTSIIDLFKHAKEKHSMDCDDLMQYHCYDCQKNSSNYSAFLNHVRLKHHPALKLRCDACDTLCDHFEHYETHRNNMCNNASLYPKTLPCKYCCKSFQSLNGLQVHIAQQHQADATKREKYKCKLCSKEFAWERTLKSHEMEHLDKPKWNCIKCEKYFYSKANLKSHIDTHETERMYSCHICSKSFKSNIILQKHQTTHTDIKPYQCDFCSKEFRTKIQKVTHERTHTGEMPFACDHCEKRFRFRSALNAHLKVHSGVKEYTCKYCSRAFSDLSNFKKHHKRKHADKEM